MMNFSLESSLYLTSSLSDIELPPTIEKETPPLDLIAESVVKVENLKILSYLASQGISDQKERFALAKIVAKTNPQKLAETIQNYAIKEERDRIELARIVAQLDGQAISISIHDFNISNETALKKIALLAATQNPDKTAEFFQNYRLTSESSRIEIAEYIAAVAGASVSCYIAQFKIKNEKARIKIAKISAAQNGQDTTEFFSNYEITDQKALKEIAKIALNQNPIGSSEEFREYHIIDIKDRLELFLYALHKKPLTECSFSFNQFFDDLDEDLKAYPLLALLIENSRTVEETQAIVRGVLTSLGFSPIPPEFIKLIENTISSDNLLLEKQCNHFLAIFLLDCQFSNIPKESIADGLELLTALLNMHAPALRSSLEHPLVELLENCKNLIYYKKLAVKSKKNWSYLPLMLVARYLALTWNLLSKETPIIETRLLKIFRDKFFKDKLQLQSLLQALHIFYSTKELTDTEKLDLLELLVFDSDKSTPSRVLKRLQRISHLITFGEIERLKSLKKAQELKMAVEETFKTQLGLDSIENFREKYAETFGTFRQPYAILTYAQSLKRLDPEEQETYLELLKSYTIAVLEKNFTTLRYSPAGGPHLKKLHTRPELIDQWKKGAKFPISELLQGPKEEEETPLSIDFQSIFSQKILLEEHYPKDLCPFLVNALREPSQIIKIKKTLQERCSALQQALKKSATEEEDRRKIKMLSVQTQAINLLLHSSFSKETREKLNTLIQQLHQLFPVKEDRPLLISDLEIIMTHLSSESGSDEENPYDHYHVLDTDDPCDLLLIGTEVAGSCQHIDYHSTVNKCLLAYLLDGKNRAMVIKDAHGKIVARCMIRLLWDSFSEMAVLFQERIYPHEIEDNLRMALNQACVERAQQLDVSLIATHTGTIPYDDTATSLGSGIPYEYVDALGSMYERGEFAITKARVVYCPTYSDEDDIVYF